MNISESKRAVLEGSFLSRHTKIVATVGPATHSPENLKKLIQAGADVIRLNMSHSTHEGHALVIKHVRLAAKSLKKHIAILVDLQGPKLRVGSLIRHEAITFTKGEEVIVTHRELMGTKRCFTISHLNDVQGKLETGQKILLKDGMVQLVIQQARDTEYVCQVEVGGTIGEHAGVNIPGVPLRLSSLTEKDKEDLFFAVEHRVSYIALSFVRAAQDVEDLKALLASKHAEIPVIAKIEKPEAVKNLDAILAVADGVMVARGDLGVELEPQEVPIVQKMVIRKANEAGKIVITATQMLESMMDHPRPTRAEASDVANAIFDGTDAIMLSEETAMGRFPFEAVNMMVAIAQKAEASEYGQHEPAQLKVQIGERYSSAVAHAACDAAVESGAQAIMVFTTSGSTARLLSKRRPVLPIVALAHSEATADRLALLWGVVPWVCPPSKTTDEMIRLGEGIVMDQGWLPKGAFVVVMAGEITSLHGATNMMKIHRLGVAFISRGANGSFGKVVLASKSGTAKAPH